MADEVAFSLEGEDIEEYLLPQTNRSSCSIQKYGKKSKK